jgi:hypothetical protein
LVTGAQWQDGTSAVPSGDTACRPAAWCWSRRTKEGTWTFSAELDDLQKRAANAEAAAQAAVSESRDQLRQRIDQARVDVDLAAKDARQQASEAAASARSKWAQMKADAADAIDFAAWTVDNAQLAVLDAIDARFYADELAREAGS